MKLTLHQSWVFIVLASLPDLAIAQSRGGSCHSPICNFFGGLIELALFGVFLLSLSASISKHGFFKGVACHPVIQFVFMYGALIGGVIAIAGLGFELGGKQGAIIATLACWLLLYLYNKYFLERSNIKKCR